MWFFMFSTIAPTKLPKKAKQIGTLKQTREQNLEKWP